VQNLANICGAKNNMILCMPVLLGLLMYLILWTRKTPLNYVSHPALKSGSTPDSGYGLLNRTIFALRSCLLYSRIYCFLYRILLAICRRPSVRLSSLCLSVVCNVRAPYSGDWNIRQCFYAIWYLGYLWPFGKNVTEIVPGEPLRRGVKPKRGRKM